MDLRQRVQYFGTVRLDHQSALRVLQRLGIIALQQRQRPVVERGDMVGVNQQGSLIEA